MLLGALIALLDALGELDLLAGGQQRHAANVLQEELQCVGRDLAGREVQRRALDLHLDLIGLLDNADIGGVEGPVDLFDLLL